MYGPKSWALITAPTDGIGLGFAEYLASKQFNIVLVGRNPEKLVKTSRYLEEKYKISAKCIVKDFSLGPANPIEFFSDLKQQTQGLDISLIVNNVGYGAASNYFHKVSVKDILNTNALNIWPIVFITRLYLEGLLNRKHKSAIINLSSISSIFPVPLYSCYSPGKSFDNVFSLVTNEEARYLSKTKNIDILSVRPGFVDTPMTRSSIKLPYLINTEECVVNSCKGIGKVNYTSGHWKHQYYEIYINCLKDFVAGILIKKALKRGNKPY